ncbi:SusC/RagA family TonB-linked outer membrane protein [Hymenobacter sp. BT507]|uniref:SusC/RagA family TonB-linked outer membrane protein n=1 Tax=Hymenobacter citatus TaxID=2763506 RepID=A0ABR7ME91_9BACT|nr:SusC/RagA family TonB-linked outer membrane protein [Hymenobacter citatus]MBC6609375.1 SusC/RagA family TonB-linked outer membrane protein [Hymenobacter citatus]
MSELYASFSKRLGRRPRGAAGWWLLVLLLSSVPAWAQNTTYTIRGTVTDIANSQGVPGATVRLTGTVLGGATNAEGNYDLRAAVAPGTYQLVVSSVGYANSTQTITLGAEPTVTANVQLRQDLIGLKEVVVTGTSVATSKQQLGNAISTVGGRELTAGAPTQIDQALQGKVAGAQISQNSGNPAGGISVRLRGTSTILGSSEPLYLVDGVIINNDSPQLLDLGGYAQNRLADIDPNDIERIEVIKGAAAAAIYGSRAANGVVQIFTKRGKEGKPSVTVSSEFIVSKVRKTLDYNKYPFRFTNTTASDLTQVPAERYDYQDQIFRTAVGTENYASVSGGSQSTKYLLSGSYFKNQGIIDATDFNRNTGRLRLQQTLTNWASVSGGASYTLSTSNEVPNGGINEAYGALTGFIFSNNFINPAPNEATGVYPSTTPTSIVTRTNPLEAINRFKFQQRTSRVVGDIQLNLTPFEGFTVDNVFGFDTYTQIGTAYIPPGNTTPTYTGGYARRGDQTVLQYNNDLTFGYRHTFNDWLESTTSLGGTWQFDRTLLTSIAAQQLVIGAETSTNGTYLANDFRAERRIEGYFLQQTLGLGQRLYLTGAIRYDAASPFYDNINQDRNWQRYLKASGSYLLSEEKFWKDSRLAEIIPQVKLRSSWGQAGNLTALGAYDQFTIYQPVSLNGQQGLYPGSVLGNSGLIPERQREFEVGTDIGLLNNRIGIEFTYFDKHVTDLLLNRTLSPTTGYLNRNENVGTMDNRGVELLVRAVPVQTSKVLWNITGTFTHNRNEVNGIEGNGVLPFAGGFGQVAAVNGQPVGVFYSTYFARNPDGSLLLNAAGLPQRELGTNGVPQRNAAGQPTGSVLSKVIGNPNPKYLASLINEVTVNEKLSFRVQLDAVQGFDVFNFTRRVGDRDLYGGLAGYEPELRGEVPKGTSAALFSIFENWIEDGSFVKVREASVSYLFAPKFLGLKNIRATVAGRNLFVFTNYSGYDPEVNAAGQSTVVRGFDFVEVPIPRTVRLGLSATF